MELNAAAGCAEYRGGRGRNELVIAAASHHHAGGSTMGKGNNAQKNDKKKMKPKQDKTKPAAKK